MRIHPLTFALFVGTAACGSASNSTSSSSAGGDGNDVGGGANHGGSGDAGGSDPIGGGSPGSGGSGGDGGGGSSACDLVPPVPSTSGPTVHVAPTGNDGNDGSASKPFATLTRALQNAKPGLRVLLGGGTYRLGTSPMRISNVNGTAAEPIVITAENGEKPVFDAAAVQDVAYDNEPYLSFSSSSYVFVDGIELVGRPYPTDVASHLDGNGKYTGPHYAGGGLGFLNSTFCTLTRSTIHQIPNEATLEIGSDLTLAGNTFYDVVLENTDQKRYFQDYWPSANVAWVQTNTDGSFKDFNHRRKYYGNVLHDSWGEGYNCLFTDACDVIGNTISRITGPRIYLDHARNVRILRNLMPDNPDGSCCGGGAISFDNEAYGGGTPAMSQDNLLIANNYFGHGSGFALFRYDGNHTATDTWSHLHIVNNIFAGSGSNQTTFYVAHVQGPTAPADGLIAGNVFLDGTMGFTLEDASAWTVRDNFFASSIPAMSAGVATSANATKKPEFLGPADGSTFTGLSLINASMLQVPTDAEVSDDALCNPRQSPKTAAGVLGP